MRAALDESGRALAEAAREVAREPAQLGIPVDRIEGPPSAAMYSGRSVRVAISCWVRGAQRCEACANLSALLLFKAKSVSRGFY